MRGRVQVLIVAIFYCSTFSAFGKTEPLSDLKKLENHSFKEFFMKRVVDADSIAKVFDAQPVNDYEKFKGRLAPDADSRLVHSKTSSGESGQNRKRLRDFSFGVFGSGSKGL